MSNIEYSGWTNWETWNCKLWLDNDFRLYHEVQDICKMGLENEKSAYDVGEYIHHLLLDLLYDREQKLWGFFEDSVNHSMRVVNWTEIAQHIMDDTEEEMKAGGESK